MPEEHTILPPALSGPVKRLLKSSWWDIENNYDSLTPQERRCLTREEHAKLLEWVMS